MKSKERPDISLCVDNVRRQIINRECNLLSAPENAKRILGLDGPMLVYPGQKLVGANTSNGILNGVIYEVAHVGAKITLRDGDRELTLSPECLGKSLRLFHAITIFSSQSRTLHGVVRICTGSAPGVVHGCFTRNILLVAASRATSIDKLILE